jgi:hypothetical protein
MIRVAQVGRKEQPPDQARDEGQRPHADEQYTLRHRFSEPEEQSKRESKKTCPNSPSLDYEVKHRHCVPPAPLKLR